ncbi:MAG: AAA family ATPase [Burkholderiales bacterium]
MFTLSDLLKTVDLERYAPLFAANEIDLASVQLLTELDLQELGLPLGPRRKLLNAIKLLDGARYRGVHKGEGSGAAEQAVSRRPLDDSERRQLTVMFCDMVGFTDLASRVDPEVLQHIIRKYEDTCAACITRFDGYVFQRLGDGIVAYFGFPLVHEGEAERAIHAGLAIIDAFAKFEIPELGNIRVRIGIATGLVVISSEQKSASGETMNLAARLQEIAPVGNIVVSESTHQLAGGLFVYEDLGAQALKGFNRLATAYRVRSVSEIFSRFDATTGGELSPIVGREQEIELLVDRWNLAKQGESQVVLLSGEPGVGKSRILAALRERLDGDAKSFLMFQCSPYHSNTAFYPIISHLERALKLGNDDTGESKLEKLETMVVGHYGRPKEDVPYLASMLSIPAAKNGDVVLAPQRFKDETFRALVDLTKAIAGKQPVIMLFEDTHWIDPTTLALLDQLIVQAINFPLLMILTHRPDFVPPWEALGHVSGIRLSKLSRAQCGLLVSRLTGGKALPPELLDNILGKTDGVPLFVEEVTKNVLESGMLRQEGDSYIYGHAGNSITVPTTLRDSLMARLERSAEAKEIAQIGAVIGREFSHELILAVVPKSATELNRALHQLIESGLVFRRGISPDFIYTFKHALVQDVAYDSLLKSRRQLLHSHIAKVIEDRQPSLRDTLPEVLAQHLSTAGQAEQSIPLWRAAAGMATKRMALKEAISHLDNAMKDAASLAPSRDRDRVELDLHASLGTVYMLAKGWAAPEVEHAYARANQLSAAVIDPEDAVRTLWGICVFHLVRGEIDYARGMGDRIMDIANSSGSRRARLVAHMLGVQLSMYSGDFTGAQTHATVAEQLYSVEDDQPMISHFSTDLRLTVRLHAAHIQWISGLPDQSIALSVQNVEFARPLNHPYSLSWAMTWGAIPLLYRREHEELLKLVEQGICIAEEHGFAYTAAIGTMARGWARAQAGAQSEGIREMKQGLTNFRKTGAEIVVPFFQTLLAELLCDVGEKDEALSLTDQAMDQIGRWGERWQEAEIHRVRGILFAAHPQADIARAEASLIQAIDIASKQGAKGWELRARVALARLLSGENHCTQARAILAPLVASFHEGAGTKDLVDARELLHSLSAAGSNSVNSE